MSGGGTWFIGDLHFGHAKVAELRGYHSVEAHDGALWHKFERMVRPGDLVYFLGDLSSGSRTGERHALDLIERLPGRKRLIAGNHDSVSSIHRTLSPHIARFNEIFERVGDYGRVNVGQKRQALLSHYPYTADHEEVPRYPQYRLPDLGMPLIHAHTHDTVAIRDREMCVSWEAWRRMVSLGDVIRWIDRLEPSEEGETE